MPTIEFTPEALKNLACEPGKSETIYWAHDLPGFGVRCRMAGSKHWFLQYRVADGATRKHTLAPFEALSLSKARAKAKDILADVTKGGDPAATEGRVRGLMTFAALSTAYLEHQKKALRPRSYAEVSRHLGDHYAPVKKLHERALATITPRDVVSALKAIAEENGPVSANRVRATLRAMWTWGLRSQLVPGSNPVTNTFKPSKEAPRARVLSDNELCLIWQHAGTGSYGRIVKLLMLTGQRREEVAGLRWSEIIKKADGTTLWVLPAERAKNHLAHDVPLVEASVTLLPPRRDTGEDHVRDLVFGGGKGGTIKQWQEGKAASKAGRTAKPGEDSFGAWSRSKARLDGRLAKANGTDKKPAPLPRWTLHDLRRTFVTELNNLGVAPHVIEAAVNHVSGASRAGVAGTYNRAAYTPQVRAAMQLWADHIAGLLSKIEGKDETSITEEIEAIEAEAA
jgi:integrase